MSYISDSWSGDDWQSYCHQLLSLRFGISYQRVPDRDRGDFGIEGFTNDGALFQCYAADSPRSHDELYTKQRNKMTSDLGKLERNRAAICDLTAPTMIRFWVLMVPRCDTKRLIQHAARKAAEVRAKALLGLDGGFSVRVMTDADFSPEKRQLDGIGRTLLPTPVPEPSDESVGFWTRQESAAMETLSRKVAAIPSVRANDPDQATLRTELIRRYLTGTATLDQIRRTQPLLWETINHEREQRERVLLGTQLLANEDERSSILAEIHLLHQRFEQVLPALVGGPAESLAWGTVAEWLIRCPLEPSNTS